jgi:hypothetical protein
MELDDVVEERLGDGGRRIWMTQGTKWAILEKRSNTVSTTDLLPTFGNLSTQSMAMSL